MAWTDIPDTDIDVASPLTTGLVTALRDNIIAAMNGDAGAPGLAYEALADVVAGNTIVYRETAAQSRTSTTYANAARYVVLQGGTLRITFEHRLQVIVADNTQARITINDVSQMSWTTGSNSYQSRSHDITVQPGDEVKVQWRMVTNSAGGEGLIRNVAVSTDGGFLWLPSGQLGYSYDEVYP